MKPERIEASGRYRIVRRLGSGGMGVVYEAEDTERGHLVALKSVSDLSPDATYRLKREFRALADVVHRNVVQFYDLRVEEGAAYYTMELLQGEHFVDWCRRGLSPGQSWPTEAGQRRLRIALAQLVDAVDALHAKGLVHRDIKPSNVIVTPEGRVVLLDLGLATTYGEAGEDTVTTRIAGTPAYMAPEQTCAAGPLTPACDWYAIGAMVYEVMAGQPPFAGSCLTILEDKRRGPPSPLRALSGDVPEDFNHLCTELLALEPPERAPGIERLRTMAGRRDASASATADPEDLFTGRTAELDQLDAHFVLARARGAVTVLVRGPSGIGKTELAQRFLSLLQRRDPQIVALRGRCYEREAMPFRALDSLVDGLSDLWRSLPGADAHYLLPRDAGLLAEAFNTLGRVPVVANAPRVAAPLDPQERRKRAIAAFRELLQRAAERFPLVLFLDDVQWIDSETRLLLEDVMLHADAPKGLLVMCERGPWERDTTRGSPDAVSWLEGHDVEWKELQVPPLPPP